MVPFGAALGLAFGNWCNKKNAEILIRLQEDIDYYSDRGISKADRWEQRTPGTY